MAYRTPSLWLLTLLFLNLMMAVGCGSGTSSGISSGISSGTSSGTSGTTGSKTLTAIALTPSSVTLNTGAAQQFAATGTYSDGSQTDVTNSAAWATSNAAVATVNASGLVNAVAAGTVPVTASIGTASASASVVVSPLPISVTINPTTATVLTKGTQAFTATVQNTSAVTWEVDGIPSGDTTVGTITGTGTTIAYNAPATPGSHTVTATSVADTTKSASATVIVSSPPPPPFPSSNHVFVVLEENHGFSEVFPNGSASNCPSSGMPYLCSLAASNGMALQFYSNIHGSLRDYLYTTSASAWTGSPYDCTGAACASEGVITGDNIVRALSAANKTWRGYFEDMPSQGYMGGDTGNYVLHHNPFPWYSDVDSSTAQQQNMFPFTQFAEDVNANDFNNFNYIVPNLLDDADGDGTQSSSALLSSADAWLNTNIAPLLSTAPFQPGGDGVLIIVFDESQVAGKSGSSSTDNSCSSSQSSGCGGHVALVMVGPIVLAGSTTSNTYHFEDMVHTIIHLLGMSDYMNTANGAVDIDLFP